MKHIQIRRGKNGMKKHLIISVDDSIIFDKAVDEIVMRTERKPKYNVKKKTMIPDKNPKLTLKANWKVK